MKAKIAYQGEPGANSHIACIEAYPDFEPLSCRTFEDAFQAVKDGYISVTPLHVDLTNYELLEVVRQWNLGQ